MGMFQNSTKETKEFEKIILEIEKERDTMLKKISKHWKSN